MNVSLRSQMTVGIAALGVATVAIAPIAQPDVLPSAQRVAAAVELAGLSNPVVAISDVAFYATQAVFDQGFLIDYVWPDSFYGVEFLYAPLNYGILPDVANQFSNGPLVGLVNNLSGYLFAGVASGLALFDAVAIAGFNTPFAAVEAVQELIGGDPEAALQTLLTEIVEPLQFGVEYALSGAGYIVDNILENVQIIATITIPYLVAGLVDAVVGSVGWIATSLVDTATAFVSDLAALDFEAAWNDVVDGILGPNGTLGQLVDQTIGIGLVQDVEGDLTVTVPSIRSVLTSELQRLGGQKFWEDGGITNDEFFGIETVGSGAAVQPAAAVAVESAPATEVDDVAPVDEPAAVTAVVADVPEAPAVADVPEAPAALADVPEAPAAVADVPEAPAAVADAPEAPAAAKASAAAESEAPAADGDGADASPQKKSSPRVGKRVAAN